MARATHRRLPADEARLRILDAAERRLRELGPEGLRLQELAKDLGISHPAILHHFGSREELISAVVVRAVAALHTELISTFAGTLASAKNIQSEELLHRIAETLSDRGQARLLAWLILSGREPTEIESGVRLRKVIQGAHAFRRTRTTRAIELADTAFIVELTAFALLGDAVFGERMRRLEGIAEDSVVASRDFRVRLGKLLEAQLGAAQQEEEPVAAPARRSSRAKAKPKLR